MRKHNAVVILQALLDGLPIELEEGVKYAFNTDNDLCIIGHYEKTNEEVLLLSYMRLKEFIDMCEKMPFDKVFIIGANNVLRNKAMGRF
jgi:hypothetical protein